MIDYLFEIRNHNYLFDKVVAKYYSVELIILIDYILLGETVYYILNHQQFKFIAVYLFANIVTDTKRVSL